MNDEAYVAYHGFVYLKGATDSHRTGLQIQIALDHEEDYKVFKEFKKHRKGKAGTGLYRAMSKNESADQWYGPVDLKFLRWTVSSANGAIVTFEMDDYDEWRKMRDGKAIDAGYEQQQLDRIELMLVELDQEGKPINVEQRAKLEQLALKRKWPKGGPQSKRAATLCRDVDFRTWLSWKLAPAKAVATPAAAIELLDVADVADWVRKEAELDSRAQLDHDEAALQRFEDRVVRPFLRSQM